MDVVKVDLPAGVTIFRVMTVERFAVLVFAVGKSVVRLNRAYTTAACHQHAEEGRWETCPLGAGSGGESLDLDGGWKCC